MLIYITHLIYLLNSLNYFKIFNQLLKKENKQKNYIKLKHHPIQIPNTKKSLVLCLLLQM